MQTTDDDVMAMFAEYQRSGNRSKRTIGVRASILRSFARRQETTLIDATVFHLRREVGREDIAASTRATTRGVFLALYGFLHAEGLRPDNPALRLPVVKVPPAKPRPYTQEQIDALLNSGAYWRTRVMILLGHYQGLRAEEIARVHRDDFDMVALTQKVFGKGARTDYLPLHPVIAELVPLMGDGYWFPARGGREGHIRGGSVSDLLHDARERAGIVDKALTGHSLRHSFGTELVRRGANIRAVQELMRHASLKTTARYTEVLDEDRRQAHSVLPSRPLPLRSGRAVPDGLSHPTAA